MESLIDRYGVWRVLRAALASARARSRRVETHSIHSLSDRMRRDIGLDPPPERPRDGGDRLRRELGPLALPHERRIWELR
ncbi:MAG: hypothetical protein AAGF49_10570 [Pseudomonadota bacterium]